jgi:hypothetical protein
MKGRHRKAKKAMKTEMKKQEQETLRRWTEKPKNEWERCELGKKTQSGQVGKLTKLTKLAKLEQRGTEEKRSQKRQENPFVEASCSPFEFHKAGPRDKGRSSNQGASKRRT